MKGHWEGLYRTRAPQELSWTQETPVASLDLIRACRLPKDAPLIDVGGGDSTLVAHLLAEGYTDLTVLDISEAAIDRARRRMGVDAERVSWIAADILDFVPERHYALWHDRAAFHFLLEDAQVNRYLEILSEAAPVHVVMGTFSLAGPERCSGLPVHRYDAESLSRLLSFGYELVESATLGHTTPAGKAQPFTFCRFAARRGL